MAGRGSVRYESAIYHVMNRGIDRRPLFGDGKDCSAFLESLESGDEAVIR